MRQPHLYSELSQTQHDTLTGLMLGDGCLYMGDSNINAQLIVGRCIKDRQYLQYEADMFANILAPRCYDGVVYSSSVDKRDDSLRQGYYFATIATPSLTSTYHHWYKDDQKKVPNDLKLNGQVIAHWIADDGSVSYNKLPYRLQCEISTHGFTKEEVEFLGKLLSDRYNERFLVRPKNRKGKTYFIIKAYDSACRTMFLDVDPYFKMDRKRIWDKTESRFWNNVPERQRSTVQGYKDRKEIVSSRIKNGKDFTLLGLIQELKYSGNPDYKSVNKLLKPYLDQGDIVKEADRSNNNAITIRILK